jgi:hypothetical protein
MAPGSLLPFAEKLVLAEAVGQRPHMQKAFGLWMGTALEVYPLQFCESELQQEVILIY